MFKIVLLIIALFILIVLLNVLILKYVLKKAINNYIKPELYKKKLIYVNYRWLGFFDQGNFGQGELDIVPASKSGRSLLTTYINVIYMQGPEQRIVTVEIETLFTKIIRLNYKF